MDAVDREFDQIELWAQLHRELGRLTFQILGPVASAQDTASTKTP